MGLQQITFKLVLFSLRYYLRSRGVVDMLTRGRMRTAPPLKPTSGITISLQGAILPGAGGSTIIVICLGSRGCTQQGAVPLHCCEGSWALGGRLVSPGAVGSDLTAGCRTPVHGRRRLSDQSD